MVVFVLVNTLLRGAKHSVVNSSTGKNIMSTSYMVVSVLVNTLLCGAKHSGLNASPGKNIYADFV